MAIGGLISNRNFGSLIGSVLPWLTMAVFANVGGWIADTLVSRGLSITAVRKGSDGFSQSGLYSNHQDIGPRYAGVLLGLSNTAGVLAGVFGTATTGYILQRGSWADVFKVAVALYIIGTLVWNFFSTGEKVCRTFFLWVYWRNTAFDLLGYPSRFDEDLHLQAVTIQEHALYIPCLSSKYQVKCY